MGIVETLPTFRQPPFADHRTGVFGKPQGNPESAFPSTFTKSPPNNFAHKTSPIFTPIMLKRSSPPENCRFFSINYPDANAIQPYPPFM